MGGFDWIIAAIFVVSILVGIFRGFIKESLSLISWILAIWLAFNYCGQAGEFIHQYINIPAPKFREWAGFALVFIATLFIFSVISYIITKIFVRGPIKGVDRVLGLGFGALRGAAIVVAL
ncbi:MAG: membrane protein required for colicin V production, partial [Arenicella sp.]